MKRFAAVIVALFILSVPNFAQVKNTKDELNIYLAFRQRDGSLKEETFRMKRLNFRICKLTLLSH